MYNHTVTHPPRPRHERVEPREIAELRQIKIASPELAPAVDLQLDLIALQRRAQSRISTPWLAFEPAWVAGRFADGLPMLRVDDVPFDWPELRLLFRQTADVLRRHDAIEDADHAAIQRYSREGLPSPGHVAAWFTVSSAHAGHARRGGDAGPAAPSAPAPVAMPDAHREVFEQVLALAARPFLARVVELLQQRFDLESWQRPYCPFCGGEPEMAVITPAADRRLVCGRCTGTWPFDPLACPYCANDDRSRITSFTSRDGRYRLYACDECRRYLKAYDGRTAARPLILSVDSIATLPLDAAAMQRGYTA